MYKKYMVLGCVVLCFSKNTVAQNVSSPYSILGVGDIESNDYGRFSASGNAAVSRREIGFYNFANPASLTVMPYKSINFDIGFRGRVSQFQLPGTDTLTDPSKDFVLKRLTLAFKPGKKTGIAFGLKPFSSVNYQYSAIESTTDGSTNFIKYIDGSGGLYQTYFSVGREIAKRLSVGATASWLFGSLQNKTTYYNPLLELNIVKNESHFYNSAGLMLGLQYYSLPASKWQQSVGVTVSGFTKLKGNYTTNYVEDTTTIKTLDPTPNEFKLPLAISAGYSIANNNGFSVHLQGSYDKWPVQKLAYQSSYTKDAYALNVGMEYSKKVQVSNVTVEKYYIGWGAKMEQSYLVINNSHINDYALTFGAGKDISRYLALNGGLEVGKRGSVSSGQIQENYVQFSLGLTLKDVWYGTKKFGRFN